MATALVETPVELLDGQHAGYLRITSPAVHTLLKTARPLPVGLLACQRDPLLKELSTSLVSWTPVVANAAPSTSKNKKKADAATATGSANGPLYDVVLQDTVLFPEGGGQPSDIGHLKLAGGAQFDVLSVRRVGLLAVHTVRPCHGAPLPTEAPSEGDIVHVSLGEDGWARRYDHMCMHTSQHLLSTLFESLCGLGTLSWSLTASPAPCYIELSRAPSAEEIARVQAELNRVLSMPRRVWVEVHDMESAHAHLPDEPFADLRQSFKGIPDDYKGGTGGVKRTICIDGIDRNACCGTHLPELHGLSVFVLPQTEAVSRGTARVLFVSGPRVVAFLANSHALLTGAATAFGCAAAQVPARAAQEFDGRRRFEKRVMDLEAEIAESIARGLVDELKLREELHAHNPPSLLQLTHHRTDDSPNALAMLDAVQKAFVASTKVSGMYVVALSCSPSAQSASTTTVVVVFGSTDGLVKAVGEALKQVGVKGGGKGPRWSGKFVGAWDPKHLQAALDKAKV